jgi:hypothetical protein
MHLPCASPLLKTKGQTGTRNMAEASPPRRGSFMNGAGDSQPRARDVASLIMKAAIVVVAALLLTGAAAGPHKVVRNSAVLEFTYRWPSEAAAIPRLDAMFYRQAKGDLAKAQADALEDRNLARRDKREFHPHYYSMVWHTVGQTPRLLSLEAAFEGFTGGAHPNHGNEALLWDRRLNRKIEASALFLKSSAFPALTRRAYCRALDAERSKRREGAKLDLPEFNACPKYSELTIAFVDKDRNGRFDTIDLVAPPYVAGPYAEGKYAVTLPVTSQLIAAIMPDYRNSFERQRQ